MKLRKSAIEKCERLARAVAAGNHEDASEAPVETLVSVRNVRVHAAFPKGGQRRRVGGEIVTGLLMGRRDAQDYEVQAVAKIALSIGKILVSKKTSQALTEITDLVNSITSQLVIAIYRGMQKS